MIILETSRTYLREIQTDDYFSICAILQDIDVMYAWEHSFSDEEVSAWVTENIMRYDRDGYSYWAVIEKNTHKLIGVSGLIAEHVGNEEYIGIGYIYNKLSWNKGYAFEVAETCKKYAFEKLKLYELTAQIRPENFSSRKLAEKLGMKVKKNFTKFYKDKEIEHLLYSIKNTETTYAKHYQL